MSSDPPSGRVCSTGIWDLFDFGAPKEWFSGFFSTGTDTSPVNAPDPARTADLLDHSIPQDASSSYRRFLKAQQHRKDAAAVSAGNDTVSVVTQGSKTALSSSGASRRLVGLVWCDHDQA